MTALPRSQSKAADALGTSPGVQVLRTVVKEHPHKSPHSRRSRVSFWLEFGL